MNVTQSIITDACKPLHKRIEELENENIYLKEAAIKRINELVDSNIKYKARIKELEELLFKEGM